MTPRQLALCVQAHNQQMTESLENKRMEIYLAANLTASFVGRLFSKKRIPSYEQTFKVKKKSKKMTAEEMYQAMKAMR